MAANLDELRGALTGDVLEPADREYERARLCFNLLVNRRPTAIARCVDAKDVAAGLQFAQANDLAQEIAEHGSNLVNIGSLFGSYLNSFVHARPVLLSGAPHAVRQFVQRNIAPVNAIMWVPQPAFSR